MYWRLKAYGTLSLRKMTYREFGKIITNYSSDAGEQSLACHAHLMLWELIVSNT